MTRGNGETNLSTGRLSDEATTSVIPDTGARCGVSRDPWVFSRPVPRLERRPLTACHAVARRATAEATETTEDKRFSGESLQLQTRRRQTSNLASTTRAQRAPRKAESGGRRISWKSGKSLNAEGRRGKLKSGRSSVPVKAIRANLPQRGRLKAAPPFDALTLAQGRQGYAG